MHRTCNCHGLSLTTRQSSNRLIWTTQTDPHAAHFFHRHTVGVFSVIKWQAKDFFNRLITHKEVTAHTHQRNHCKILINRCDTSRDCITRVLKKKWLAFKINLPCRRFMHARHGLDKRRFTRAIIAQKTMAFACMNIERHPSQSDDRPKMFLNINHIYNRVRHLSALL